MGDNQNSINKVPTVRNSRYPSRYGPWALVTGASSGIGAAFARHLAARGLNIIAVARRRDLLDALSEELQQYDVHTVVIVADLTTNDGLSTLEMQTENYDVGLVVNNAGRMYLGEFVKCSPTNDINNMIDLNITVVTRISHLFLRRVSNSHPKRSTFGIIFVSSMSSNGCPFLSVYSATKAYLSCLTYALQEEYKSQYDFMAVEPGFVQSEMTLGIGEVEDPSKFLGMISANKCVDLSLRNFGYGKRRFTPGFLNRIFKNIMLWIPRSWAMTLLASSMRPAANRVKIHTE